MYYNYKNVFSALLKKLWEKIMGSSAENLRAGFKKTGIYPTNETPVLQRMPTIRVPDSPLQDVSLISESFVEFLENKRKEVVGVGAKRRKKKVNAVAGKSISIEDIIQAEPSSNGPKPQKSKKKTKDNSSSKSEDHHLTRKSSTLQILIDIYTLIDCLDTLNVYCRLV